MRRDGGVGKGWCGVPSKKCKRCQVEKPMKEFHKDVDRKDGKRPYCKTCVKVYRAKKAIERERQLGDCEIHHMCVCKQKRMAMLEKENWRLSRELAHMRAYDDRQATNNSH